MIKKGLSVAKNEGPTALWCGVSEKFEKLFFDIKYRKWVQKYQELTSKDLAILHGSALDLQYRPLISILMPVYNTPERFLREAIDSVIAQVYDRWELCIADDASTNTYIGPLLRTYAETDSRIKVRFRSNNGHISAASNTALEQATGDFTALMDHDDVLHPAALYFVVKELNTFPQTKLVYTDEDKITSRGARYQPSFKPDWSPELLYSLNFVTHLIVYETGALRSVGGFRIGFEGSQDYDLALRISAGLNENEIRHIPRVLYHWRAASGSVALSSEEKPYAHEKARLAITEALARKQIAATSVKGHGELHRVSFDRSRHKSSVSIILFGNIRNQRVFDSVSNTCDHDLSEVAGFSFNDLNTASRLTNGEFLCFLNAVTTRLSNGWLDELVGYAGLPDVGAVGPKIVDHRDRIRSAGYLLGLGPGVGRPYLNTLNGMRGYFYYLVAARNVTAVPVDCLVIKRKVFDALNGFDALSFDRRYGDIDLCLRMLKDGYRNVWTPWSEIMQPLEPFPDDLAILEILRTRHTDWFELDPYYNPNLSLDREFALAEPPRVHKF